MGVVAELVPEEQLSDYELERGKPIPSKNHGLVQAFLIMALSKYIDKYNILCEVALDLYPSLTPDITIYPKFVMDWIHDEIRMSELPYSSHRNFISQTICVRSD